MCIAMEAAKRTPRSPYRRHKTEMPRLRLSRHVIKGPKVNLNQYWSKFEELNDKKLPLLEFQPVTAILSFENDVNQILDEFKDLGK